MTIAALREGRGLLLEGQAFGSTSFAIASVLHPRRSTLGWPVTLSEKCMANTTNETNQTSPVHPERKWPRKVLMAVFGTIHLIISLVRWWDRLVRLWEILKSWLADL